MIASSPLRYTKEVFLNLLNKGYEKEVPLEVLIASIKYIIGIVHPKTVQNLVRTYRELDYIKLSSDGATWIIKYWDKNSKEATENA